MKRNDLFQLKKFTKQTVIQTVTAILVIAAIVCGDYFVKRLSVRLCKGGSDIVLIPKLISFTYTTNDGAAWSILRGKQLFFVILTVIVLLFVIWIYLKGWVEGWFGIVSLAACVGGTIGNFIDRVRFGYVVDMFRTLFVEFPIFNVADIFLTLGCIAIGVYILFLYDKNKS